MKIKLIYIGLCIVLLSWIIPALFQIATDSVSRYPFTYYSSVIHKFCFLDMENDQVRGRDTDGNTYSDKEFDRVLPLFYYRQLAMDKTLPDSIEGVAVDIPTISRNTFFFRYRPKDIHTPVIALYPMFESFSGKVNIENPDDMFRLKNRIEFIDIKSNRVNKEKSDYFQQALEKNGFVFPARWVSGIPNNRKNYDEGYFVLDDQNQLFHIKMVNGKPFVKDTKAGDSIQVLAMLPIDVENRSMYGFLFDTNHNFYYLSTDQYRLVKILEGVNPQQDRISIMANPLYWNVAKETKEGESVYALRNQTMEQVDHLFRPAILSTWDKIHSYLFPFTIQFQQSDSAYIYPRVSSYNFKSLGLNLILAVLVLIGYRKQTSKQKYGYAGIVLVTGIAGFIATVVLNYEKE